MTLSNVLLVAASGFAAASVFVARSEPAATKGVVQLASQAASGKTDAASVPEPGVAFDAAAPMVLPPQHLRIDTIGVSAATVSVGLASDGSLAVSDPGTTGWYELGVRPGQAGYAVIAGHVDTYQGPDVFYKLRDLQPGAEIVVQDQAGADLTFVVESVEQQAKTALPTSRMWQPAPRPMLALITCGGAFDRKQRTYLDNVVVYAALAPERPPSSLAAARRV